MKEQLFQIGIKAFVKNSDDKILLLGMNTGRDDELRWDLPGGRMEAGETFLQTLRRELEEELGIDLLLDKTNTQLLTAVLSNITIPVVDSRVPLVLIPYRVTLPTDAVITLDPSSKEQAYEWCSLIEVAERLTHKYPDDFCNSIKEI